MPTFSGRLFNKTFPGSGAAATGEWQDDGSLKILAAAEEFVVYELTLTASGFNAESLKISWQDDEGESALLIDLLQIDACRIDAPPRFQEQFHAANQHFKAVDRRFRYGRAFLFSLLLLPVILLLCAYLYREELTDWLVEHIPLRQEELIGEAVLKQTRLTTGLIESGGAVNTLKSIGTPLTAGTRYQYRWFISKQKDINAFAAPGGVVVVTSGLLKMVKTPEELAGVLAHEIAHAEQRHGLKVIVKSLGMRTLAGLLLGDYGGTAVAEGIKKMGELSFSRNAEREADQDALRRLVAAGIDPSGLLTFLQHLEKSETNLTPEFLSTHPATAARISSLQRELSQLQPSWRPLEISLSEIRADLPPL